MKYTLGFSVKLLMFLLILSNNSFAQNSDTIIINSNQYFKDQGNNIVLSNLKIDYINSNWNNPKTHIQLDSLYVFSQAITTIETGVRYNLTNTINNNVFHLYFTELPIVAISTNEQIVDETDVLAYFKIIDTNQNYIQSHVGIQYRGSWSQTFPKKSMEIEFWTDATGNSTQDFSLLDMVNDDDWNLQAMYNEPLRIRSKTNNELWPMINKLHYEAQENEAINGIRMKYIELFINNEYNGLYSLGEKVNRKQLKLKKHNGNIRGELYKGIDWGASTFTELPPYSNNSITWSGFEYKHPDEEIDWSNLHELVDFVINAQDPNFYAEYQNHFHLDNLIDYYIFLNLLRATDNTGKNIYLAKYNTNDKYFYVPWDLDGALGTLWDGSNDFTTNDLLSNGFYDRLWYDCKQNGFREKLKNRWLEIRTDLITHDSLMTLLTSNYELLLNNGVYEREELIWDNYNMESQDLNYISDWLTNRLSYLDGKFNEPCIPLSTDNEELELENITFYPNPTNDLIFLNRTLEDDSAVTVYNVFGQKVLQEIVNSENKAISLKHLNSGVYFINVNYKGALHTQKIILNK